MSRLIHLIFILSFDGSLSSSGLIASSPYCFPRTILSRDCHHCFLRMLLLLNFWSCPNKCVEAIECIHIGQALCSLCELSSKDLTCRLSLSSTCSCVMDLFRTPHNHQPSCSGLFASGSSRIEAGRFGARILSSKECSFIWTAFKLSQAKSFIFS